MATTSTADIIAYYQDLLIIQYNGLDKAAGTIGALAAAGILPQTSVQVVTFGAIATTGAITFSYNGSTTAAINWNDSQSTTQTKFRAVTGLGSVTVAGSIAGKSFTVTFTGVNGVALPLTVATNTLLATATPVAVAIAETDETLPLAIENGFNLTGSNIATGAQLDILGKYVGVTRTGNGFYSVVTLNDSDFLSLIRTAIIKNSSGSSLATIQDFIHQFFAGEMLVFDYANMRLSYLVSTAIGSQNLIQLFVTEGILPAPMGVGISIIIYAPIIDKFFGFRTYLAAAFNAEPFNTYATYNMDWPFLSYSNAIIPP